MIGGLGAIGVASAGAGLGTTAFFSDSESFEENTLTAGELDLFVHVDYEEDQGSFAQYSTPPGTFINGGVVGESVSDDGTGISIEQGDPLSIQVEDLKPGDSGEGKFCFSIVFNPAYMWMCGELTADILPRLKPCLLPTSSNAAADELTPEDGAPFTELATRT